MIENKDANILQGQNENGLRDSIHDVSNPSKPLESGQGEGSDYATMQPGNQASLMGTLITPAELNHFDNLDYSMSNT